MVSGQQNRGHRPVVPHLRPGILGGLQQMCIRDRLTAYQRKNLLNGPGKLCRALQLTRQENGLPLSGPELYVEDGPTPAVIHTGKRIGIDYAEEAADFPWRFWTDPM